MGRLVTILMAAAVLLALAIWIAGGRLAVLASAQVGFWSAALVVLTSFGSYRRMVRRRLEAGMVPDAGAERDTVDRLEDPYDLYSEEEGSEPQESLRETIRREKAHLKKNRRSPFTVARDAVPAFSLWRLGAYGVLVLGFFWLKGSGLLSLGAYLPSLALPIILAVWILMRTEGPRAESA